MKVNPLRLFTLGLIPTLMKNSLMALGFVPQSLGFSYMPLNFLYCAGAVIVSHPFELARVMVQYDKTSGLFGSSWKTITSVYAHEGLTGLFRGLIPRTIHTLPVLMTTSALIDSQKSFLGYPPVPE